MLSTTLADGSTSHIEGVGAANPIPSLFFSSVFYIPKFLFNLLSVSWLTKSLNCLVTFFPDHCVIQELEMQRTIGTGRESGGIILRGSKIVACSSSIPYQLGHPSLQILKTLTCFVSCVFIRLWVMSVG